MPFLTGLHGSIATILICVLLFIDEAGVPLPLCPNEVLLIFAGLLIASGAVPVFIFFPAAVVAMGLGSFCGYSWAKTVGPRQLRAIAEKLRAARALDSATSRMRNARPGAMFVTRLIPGVRVYATLIAGAADVPLRQFMEASLPAIVVWAAIMTTLGFFVGVPAEHFFGLVQNLALSGGLLVALGLLGYRSATRAIGPRAVAGDGPFHGIAKRDRYWLAPLVDFGVVATIAAGLDRLTRSIGIHFHAPFGPQNGSLWDVLTVIAAIGFGYVVLARRSSTGETAGERLFDVSYVHFRTRRKRERPEQQAR